jgi:phosphate transport system protein
MDETLNLDQHISQRFNEELEDVRAQVLRMGGLVEDQCSRALEALTTGNERVAREVAGGDHAVNALEVAINAKCTDILALRHPAASDLRMIVAIIRLASDLERIGDEAEKIGRLAEKLLASGDSTGFRGDPRHLGSSALDILHGALDAFARLDVEAAINTAAKDVAIDDEFESVTRLLITHMMEQPSRVNSLLQVNWCARALERIGDHAVNICEEVIFLVKGSDVRHMSLQEIRDRYL